MSNYTINTRVNAVTLENIIQLDYIKFRLNGQTMELIEKGKSILEKFINEKNRKLDIDMNGLSNIAGPSGPTR